MTIRERFLSKAALQTAFAVCAVVFIGLLESATTSQAAQFVVTDLDALGGDSSVAEGINNRGQVIGSRYFQDSDRWSAFLWTPNERNGTTGTIHELGTLGGTNSFGEGDINESGQVTGFSSLAGDAESHAFLWTPSVPNGSTGTMLDLGTLSGNAGESFGYGINDEGRVVGVSDGDRAFLYDGTMMHDLGTLGGDSSAARAINNVGQVAGGPLRILGNVSHPFLWTPTTPNGIIGTMRDLGSLLAFGESGGIGRDVNDSGHVTGESTSIPGSSRDYHAFLYDGTTMHDLGTLGGPQSAGWGINSSGHVVGNARLPSTANSAFLWTSSSGMVDLNTLIDPYSGWILQSARGINDAGQIVGLGSVGGQVRAFLLTPVPEPGCLGLAMGGIFVLLFTSLRRLHSTSSR